MIIEAICDLLFTLVQSVISVVISPLEGLESIMSYINLMVTSGVDIFRFFIPPTARVILLVIINFKIFIDFYEPIMWIIKKIPFINIH